MSTASPTFTPAASASAETRIPFATLVRVELKKSYDTRSGFWLLFGTAALIILAELITALAAGFNYRDAGPGRLPTLLAWDNFSAVAGIIMEILVPVIGILLVTSEWGQRTGMVTFALEPRRSSVVWAKVVAASVLTLGTVVVAIVMGAVFNALYGSIAGHVDWTFPIKGILGFLVAQELTMLSCFAFGALFLNAAAAIVFTIAAHFLIPVIFAWGESLMSWFNSLGPWIDELSASAPLYDWSFTGKEWGQFATAEVLWFVIPFCLAMWRILHAEVK